MLEEGTTIGAAAERFGVKKWQARKWLEWLRIAGAAHVDGERSAARWRLAPPLGEGDAQ
jgi:transposase-like protein